MNEMLSVNSNISHYRILSKIGAGGMGEVYLAEDVKLGRKVALKILPENIASDKERLGRFEQEARAASGLNHPHILTVYEFGFEGGMHFLATEFVEGVTLREKIKDGELSLIESLNIAEQTAFALSAAHSAGIVHRDLKPENIMIRRDGIVKVLDSGLAKLIEKKEANADSEAETRALIKTNPGVVMGTTLYMSPEQAKGKEADERTDIWSLGCVLYEMVSGKMPFTGETPNEVIASILKSEPLPLSHHILGITSELERIVGKTLRKNREERYQHIKDLQIDLKDLRQDLEFQAKLERSTAPNKKDENITAKDFEQATQILEKDKPTNTNVAISPKNEISNSAHPVSSAEYVVSEIKQHKRRVLAALSILLLTAIGLGFWYFGNHLRSSNSAPIQSIAVLPFENASGNADLDYLSEGVSESVIDRLSQLPQLKVIARSSSFQYRGQNLDLRQIADALAVQAIVTGRVAHRGDSYLIRVDVTDVRENKQLWGENFTRKTSDFQILQSDISREIAENLRLRLSGAHLQQFANPGTTSPQAYELLLKGRYHFNKTGVEEFHKAVEYYEQAIAADPNYALAFAELAEGYNYNGGRGLDRKQRLIRQEAAARRALELDPNLAEAHYAMAEVKRRQWEWQEAEREYLRAIELNPNLPQAFRGYAQYLGVMGRHAEAIAQANRARELAPLSPLTTGQAASRLYAARRYDEAIEVWKKNAELNPDSPMPRYWLGNVYAAKEMYREAIAEYREAIRRHSGEAATIEALIGVIYAKTGERRLAEEILQKVKMAPSDTSPSPLAAFYDRSLALLYDALGLRDEALAQLEKAYAERNPNLPLAATDPAFDNLRSDQRFQDLLRRMGLPQ
jgi:eukaryotic-like serine/threonine-protein kinase